VTAPATSEETAEPVAAKSATESSTAVPLIVTLTIEKEAAEKRLGLIMTGTSTPRICSFHPGSLGEKEGMLIGDEILTINGEKPAGHDEAGQKILSSATLVIEIRRACAGDPAATVPPTAEPPVSEIVEYTFVVDPEVKQSI
jgi:membrane-associated protease RseP (regulator of RpoE activity)